MKKILKKGIILIVVILVSFLFYSNWKTSGVWVGSNEVFANGSINSKLANQSVLEFKNQKVSEIRPFQSIDSIRYNYYLSIGKYLFADLTDEIETTQISIRNYYYDSLIVTGQVLKSIYRKAPTSLKYKSKRTLELENKFFKLKSGELIDSIFFSEKFLFFKKTGDNGKIWDSSGYWELKKVNDYYILFTNFVPFIINWNGDKLFFTQILDTGMNEIEVIESEGNIAELKETLKRMKN